MVILNSLILNSKNPQELFSFLSFIFDIENFSFEDDIILFEYAAQKFSIKKSNHVEKEIHFDFVVDDLDDLTELSQKIEFFHYRNGTANNQKLSGNYLNFIDSDERNWLVRYVEKVIPFLDGNKNKTQSNIQM